mgnify:CR=1 FL=1
MSFVPEETDPEALVQEAANTARSLVESRGLARVALANYFAGAVLTPLGVLGGLVALWEKFVMGYPVLFVHGVLSFLVFMMGMQFLLFAMLFDMQAEAQTTGGRL